MNIRSVFAIAALVAAAAVAGIAYFLVPDQKWTGATICALALLACSVGFSISPPFSFPSKRLGGNAAILASLGPTGLVLGTLLIWSALTFVVALTGRNSIAWAMMIANIAGFVTSILLVYATSKIIDQAAANTHTGPSVHMQWHRQIEILLATVTDSETKYTIRRLSEKFQYAASEIAGSTCKFNQQIDSEIMSMQEYVAGGEGHNGTLVAQVTRTSGLLDQREAFLRGARSKA